MMHTVHVVYHQTPVGVWADSDDMHGFGVAAPTLTEVRDRVRNGVPRFLGLPPEEVDLRESWPGGRPVVDLQLTATPAGRLRNP